MRVPESFHADRKIKTSEFASAIRTVDTTYSQSYIATKLRAAAIHGAIECEKTEGGRIIKVDAMKAFEWYQNMMETPKWSSKNRKKNPKRGPRDETRERTICERYENGETMQEIGDSFGLTRERIRQILCRNAIQSRPKGARTKTGL